MQSPEKRLQPAQAFHQSEVEHSSTFVTYAPLAPLSTEIGGMSFQHWLDISPDALVIVDAQGLITFANRQIEVVFGYDRSEILGHSLEILLPERFRDLHVHHRQDYATSPRIRPMGAGLELYGRCKDGTEVPVDISLSPLHIDGAFYALAAIRDITERRRLQERERLARVEAEAHLKFLQLILDQLPLGVALVEGIEARLVLANHATRAIWNAPWQIGQELEDFLTVNHIRLLSVEGHQLEKDEFATLRAVQQGETVRQYQEIIQHSDGSRLPVLVKAVTIDWDLTTGMRASESAVLSSEPIAPVALVVYQDESERMELERRKDEFIGMASHELRTPVTSIKTYIQWLRRRLLKAGDEVSAHVLTKVDQQLGQLTRLVTELLDITQMETGHLPFHEETFELGQLVAEITSDLVRTTEHHQIQIEGDGAILIYADRERIGQVLTNLLTNAIKYMPQGGIIRVTQRIQENEVTVEVTDTGIGIPQEKQAHVFERFYRVTSQSHESFPGLGLGLYLSAEIIKLHGGRIWVESESGVGSTFSFRLPIPSQPSSGEGEQR